MRKNFKKVSPNFEENAVPDKQLLIKTTFSANNYEKDCEVESKSNKLNMQSDCPIKN